MMKEMPELKICPAVSMKVLEGEEPNWKRKVQVSFGHGATSNSMRSYGNPKGASFGQSDGVGGLAPKIEKEYKEPWNYYSYYHVNVPLRRPYFGDPVHLDEAEFGEVSSNMTYNDEALNTAEDLGLMEDEDSRLIFLQLPACLPLTKRSAAAEGNKTASNSNHRGQWDDQIEVAVWKNFLLDSWVNSWCTIVAKLK